jgi:serine phosphatase RsbU (regulator of sigma subunit)/pSer/pThr/pTyr-binding forkhead associated (FHA) protein
LLQLGESAVLGRQPDCDIVLEAGAVSRQHARIVRLGAGYFVEDLQSRNGTFVNGVRVEGRHKLSEDDELKICDLVFSFHQDQVPEGTEDGHDESSRTVTQTVDAVQMVDDEREATGSTIMSKLEVSTGSTSMRLTVNPEVKLKALLEIGRNLGRATRIDEVLPQLLDNLFKIFIQADRGFIALVETAAKKLTTKAVKFRHEDAGGRIRMSRTILNAVMGTKEAILSADASTDSQFRMSESIVDFHIHSVMCAPLLDSDGAVLGVIHIDTTDARRRFNRDDLDVLASVACQAAVAVENAQLHERAIREELLEKELSLAHRVQLGLLPASPPQIERYQFFQFYQPAYQLGGDYFDYILLPGNRLASALADVCGKGIAAALLVARLSAEVRHCLLSQPQPADAMVRLNQLFANDRWEGKFVTMVAAVLDPAEHEVCIVNAGHMAPLLRRPSGEIEEVGRSMGGLPLGIDGDSKYEQFSIRLGPGDSLVMYTDGVLDAENAQKQRYGTERLYPMVAKPAAGAQELGSQVINDVKRFVGDHRQADDICLTCLRRME